MDAPRIVWLAIAALMPMSDLGAQEAITPGTRIRVTAPAIAEKPISGTVSSVDSASITLASPSGQVPAEQVIPLASVSRLELSRGRSHRPFKGMRTGLLVGSGAGLLLGVAAAADDDSGFLCEGGECVALGTLSGALWGTVIGGLLGAAIGSPKWEEVVVARPSLSIVPQAGGLALAVSLKL